MSWFRVDDGFHNHPKVIAAGTGAAGLFVRCGSYCAQHLTDGHVPTGIAKLYGSASMIRALVDAAMWTPVPGGYLIHDYLDFNPSRADVEKERAAKSERQARWLANKKARDASTDASRDASKDAAPTRPDPTPKGLGRVGAHNSRNAPCDQPVDNFRPALTVVRECWGCQAAYRLDTPGADGLCPGCAEAVSA